jgi:hypothetical protein
VWVCVCVDFIKCGCVYLGILLCVGVCICVCVWILLSVGVCKCGILICGCFGNMLLVFTAFCIVFTVFLYCFVYVYYLFCLYCCKDYCHSVTTELQ